MNTNKPGEETGAGPFSEAEVEAVTQGPATDPELDEVDAAEIDATEQETPFEKIVAHGRRMKPKQIRNVVESVLFVAPQPLSLDQLFEATGIDREKLLKALGELQGDRREGLSGVVLHEVAGWWQFRTAPESSEYVRRFLKVKPQRLTRAALETMSIVAYRQPVTRPEIEDIRGVDSGAVLKALLDRRLIKILGKKEEVGRPILYGTSREFLAFFALKDLSELPTLLEFQELTEESQEVVEKEAPPKPGAAGTVEALADPTFKKKLEESDEASEAALADLEAAIGHADETSKAAARVLDPHAPPPDPAASPAVAPPAPPSEPGSVTGA